MLSPVSLGGAKQRLLAERIPALFFGTAVIAHVITWAALAAVAHDLPSFAGGPGPVLAAVHTLTLGVLVTTAIGASLQMLPVALGHPAPAEGVCLVIFGTLVTGAVLLITGFALTSVTLMTSAALPLVAAVALYVREIAQLLRGSVGPLRWFVLTAVSALGVAALLAAALAANYSLGFLPEHGRIAAVHAVLAGFGFMGLMALGLSQILIPMFAIAEPPEEAPLWRAYGLAAAALALALLGLGGGVAALTAAGAGVGLLAAAQHIQTMRAVVAKRLRRRMGPEFILIGASWVALPLALLGAAGGALDLLPATGGALVIVLVLYGWLLSLLTGVLQRILPFLASMQAARAQARSLAPAKLVEERALQVHFYGHIGGLSAVAAGTAVAVPGLIIAGAAAGTLGALGFAWFALKVLQRTRSHIKAHALGRLSPS
ncbi:MAG: hypothetical protein P9C48_14370 [Defluviicoccus sp.]|nr:hypothetical protein [Defluviicoccus sp.]MDG4610304.1 hypothetical protein [Defluviicoccus sp.]